MKCGQGAGTDTSISGLMWLKEYFRGPQLFITATDKSAEEFGRERFELVIRDMPPLMKRYVQVKGGLTTKRFVDGKIQLAGGKSINNFLSHPWKVVCFDEVDSVVENLAGQGDPIALAENRGDSFSGATLILAYAHPTTKSRGAGKLYYTLSDQRRGFMKHAKERGGCGKEIWLPGPLEYWKQIVRATPRLEGQTQEQADRDPDCYALWCPHCGEQIPDAERVLMLRGSIEQKSTLPPDVAATRTWIGTHTSHLYTPHKSLRSLVVRYIAALDDENKMRVFVNKVLGDCYESKTQKTDIRALRELIVVRRRQNDPEFFSRGQVPPFVQFLTAGQDSRETQFHYAVWGWGIRIGTDNVRRLCGCLIDWGELSRSYSQTFEEAEFHRFDDLLYRMRYPASPASPDPDRRFHLLIGGHDIGFQPTQIPIIRYCRSWPGRAVPCRGSAQTMTSAMKADPYRRGTARKHQAGDEEVFDDGALSFNTYLLKLQWYGDVALRFEVADLVEGRQVGTRPVSVLTLPENTDSLWLKQSSSEYLTKDKDGDDYWDHDGANHLADCNIYAYGAALSLEPFAHNQTAEEYDRARQGSTEPEIYDDNPRGEEHDPSLG